MLDLLYDAAADAEKWTLFLQALADTIDASKAAILFNNYNDQRYNVAFQMGFDEEAQRAYHQYYGKVDVFFLRALQHKGGWIGTGQSLIRDEELLKTEHYNDFMRRTDTFHECGALIDGSTQGYMSGITLLRPKQYAQFSDDHVELVKFLLPHLKREFQIHHKMTDLKARATVMESALDGMPFGILFLDVTARVTIINRAAQALLAANDGLIYSNGKLAASMPSETRSLKPAVQGAVHTGSGRIGGPGGVLSISRKAKKPLYLVISPCRSREISMTSPVAAVVFVTDPDHVPRPHHEMLKHAYGLSPAECRLSALLCDGRSLHEIGDLLRVSNNTLKSQLQSIFAKTGTARQSQLVRLLAQLGAVGSK